MFGDPGARGVRAIFSLLTNSLAMVDLATYIGIIEFWPDGSASPA